MCMKKNVPYVVPQIPSGLALHRRISHLQPILLHLSFTSISYKIPPFEMNSRPQSKIELRIACRHLPNKDVLSKSDPQVVLFTASPLRGGQWQEYARTEVIKDNLNPSFAKGIDIDYFFEEVIVHCSGNFRRGTLILPLLRNKN